MLKSIHKLPQGTRELMFALSVITTISLVGLVWVKSFEKQLFVLLNPDKQQVDKNDDQIAEVETPSLFATIGEAFKDLKASLQKSLGHSTETVNEVEVNMGEEQKPIPLPVER